MRCRLDVAICLVVLFVSFESCTTAPPKLYTHYNTTLNDRKQNGIVF